MSKFSLLTIIILCSELFRDLRATDLTCYVLDDLMDCDGKESITVSNYFDSSNLEVDFNDDGYMVLDGYATFLEDLDPSIKVYQKSKLYKKSNGYWADMGYTLERRDFCSVLMDSKETWYETTKDFDQSGQQLCSPVKGTKFGFDKKIVQANLRDAPSSGDIVGEYKLVMDFSTDEFEICTYALLWCEKS